MKGGWSDDGTMTGRGRYLEEPEDGVVSAVPEVDEVSVAGQRQVGRHEHADLHVDHKFLTKRRTHW